MFPNAPYFNGSYVNDKVLGSNYNYLTTQAELGTPLWLPGEGRATQATAQADGAAVAAAIDAAHLALAQQVLDLAAQAALAVGDRDVAARRLATAQALAADLTRRFRIGESSQSDALAAEADADGATVTLSSAKAQLGAARAALAVVVGNDLLPRLDVPGLAARTPAAQPAADPLAAHPRVVAAQRAVEAAQASARLVGIEDRDSPEVGLQGINEKQPGTRWDTRFGVTFRLPFATEARNAPRRAAAEQAVTQAVVQLVQAQRAVLAAVRQAEAVLAGAERGSVAAERAAAGLVKRRGQIGRAWQVGEMPLIELVRANALSYDAEAAREKARTELATARLHLRLAQGVAAVPLLAVGDPARVRVAPGNRTWDGKVVSLGAALDPQARTPPARIGLANPDGALRAGMFMQVVLTSDRGRDDLVVPSGAVQAVGDKRVAFTPLGGDRFQSHDLTLGVERQDWTEVRKGLAAGDEVVVQGSFELKALLQKAMLDDAG